MKYPKAVMSITELAEMGFSRKELTKAAHHHLSSKYIVKTIGGGKYFFKTEEFEKYMKYIFK